MPEKTTGALKRVYSEPVMLTSYAQQSDIEYLGRFFAEKLSKEATRVAGGHMHPNGKEPWTKAVWHCFETLRVELGAGWTLYPKDPGKGPGKAKGEYLADFLLMDETFGPRIACESELGNAGKCDWSFDKLRGLKADIKMFIFEMGFTENDSLPPPIESMVTGYLSNHAHFLANEHFLLVQLSFGKTRCFHWEPTIRGPYTPTQIHFSFLNPDPLNLVE